MPDVGPWLSMALEEDAVTPHLDPPYQAHMHCWWRGPHVSGGAWEVMFPQPRTECAGVERPSHLASARTTSGVPFTRRAPHGIRRTLDFSQPSPFPIRLPPLTSGCS